MQGSYVSGPFITPAGIKDRPFQADYEQVTTKKTSNDNTSRHVKQGAIYRATNGRSRREEYAGGGTEKKPGTIIIHNPAKQEGYLLDVESKTFFTMPTPASESQDELPTFKGEDAGRKVIEGLMCRGYRMKQQSEEIEYWVAEDLLEVVLAKSVSKDEESTLRLFNIRRIEPDGKLFSVPVNYKTAVIE
jgi:hypothetical protein